MRVPRFISNLILLLLLAACVGGISWTQRRLNGLKVEHGLVLAHSADKMTPTMAFTTGALGAFRGLIADVLFLRLNHLQEQDKHFEIHELGHLILQLQPDMPGAITFLAWNMAYNISVKYSSPQDRWRWVQRGVELLRDYAIRFNPTDPDIYHQLGWIYQHKMGQILDDANNYYKSQLPLQIMEALGEAKRYDWDRLAAAPNTEDELKGLLGRQVVSMLFLKIPEGDPKVLDEAILGLASRLAKEGRLPEYWDKRLGEFDIKDEFVSCLKHYRKDGDEAKVREAVERSYVLLGAKAQLYRLLKAKDITHRRLEEEFRIVSNERPSGGIPDRLKADIEELGLTQLLDDYFRTRWLRDVYKIDADFMPKVIAKTGYLDIRLPETHAVYWAEVGLQYAPEDRDLNRMVAQSLTKAARYGVLRYISPEGLAVTGPNFEAIEKYIEIYERDGVKHTLGDKGGYENFLKDSIVVLYLFGEEKLARKYFKHYKQTGLPNTHKYKNHTLEQFALSLGSEDVKDKDAKQVSAIMDGLSVQYLRAVAFDEIDRAERMLHLLNRTHDRYYETVTGARQIDRRRIKTVEQSLVGAKLNLVMTAPTPELRKLYLSARPDLNDEAQQILNRIRDQRNKRQRN